MGVMKRMVRTGGSRGIGDNMLMMNFGVGTFFDRSRIQRAVDRAKRRVLVRQGAYVRTVAQHLIHERPGASRPGNPPHSHRGFLRDQIYYAYDLAAESVVIGPRVFTPNRDVPALLEFGGLGFQPGRSGHYPARPYMGPALEQSRPKLAEFWQGSVRG